MRTAILGAGALGIIIGARMAKNGKQVDLIDTHSAAHGWPKTANRSI